MQGDGMAFLDDYFTLVDSTLSEWQIYDIEHYGWLDADTDDPEYSGLGWWSHFSPSNYSRYQDLNNGQMKRVPTEFDQKIGKRTDDFFGIMGAARMSLGQMLLFGRTVRWFESPSIDPGHRSFWLAHATTTFLLGTGVTRLYVVAKEAGVCPAAVQPRNKRAYAILSLADVLREGELTGELAQAGERVRQSASFLKDILDQRDELAHEAASVEGRSTSELFAMLLQDATGAARSFQRAAPETDDDAACFEKLVRTPVGAYRGLIEYANLLLWLLMSRHIVTWER
jgi:hypothetical protein